MWHFGQLLFRAYHGEAAASYPSACLEHCRDLGHDPRAAAPILLASALEPQPAPHKPHFATDGGGRGSSYGGGAGGSGQTSSADVDASRIQTSRKMREAASAEMDAPRPPKEVYGGAAAHSAEATKPPRSRHLAPVPPLAYDPFANLKRKRAPRAADEADAAGGGAAAGAQTMDGLDLSRARSIVDAAQLPSVSPRRAVGAPDSAWTAAAPSMGTATATPAPGKGHGRSTSYTSSSAAAVPIEIDDVIAACLQAHPDARPSVDALLASRLFAIDQATLLSAKRAAAQYVRLPRPRPHVAHAFGKPLAEVHRLLLASGKMPTHLFERLLQEVLDACTEPFEALLAASSGSGATAAKAVRFEEIGFSPPPPSAKERRNGQGAPVPVTPADREACEALVAEIIESSDVWGGLRLICLHDLYEQSRLYGEAPRTDARCSCLLRLARALRSAIAHADVPGSFLKPHAGSLLFQLVSLAAGDVSLAPGALLASSWHPSQMSGRASVLAARSSRRANKQAADAAAVAAAAAKAVRGVGGRRRHRRRRPRRWRRRRAALASGALRVSRAPARRRGRRMAVLCSFERQALDADAAGRHPSGHGGGALGGRRRRLSLPSLREALFRQTAGRRRRRRRAAPLLSPAAAAAAALGAGSSSSTTSTTTYSSSGGGAHPPLFANGSPASRGEALGGLLRQRELTRGYCAEVVAALASLRSLQPGLGGVSGKEARRARVTGLTHFTGMLRRRPALRLCIDLRLPQHAFGCSPTTTSTCAPPPSSSSCGWRTSSPSRRRRTRRRRARLRAVAALRGLCAARARARARPAAARRARAQAQSARAVAPSASWHAPTMTASRRASCAPTCGGRS